MPRSEQTPMSQAERKWVKRKIDRLLKDFDSMDRSKLSAKLHYIARQVKPFAICESKT